MKTLIAALVSVAASAAWAQDFDVPVTLKTSGMTMADVVAKLRAATKADLNVTAVVGREVVLVDVKDVKAKDLMAKLAATVGGEWVKSDSMYKLIVTDTALRKAVSQRVAADTVAVKKALAKMAEQVKPNEPFSPPQGGGPQILSPDGGAQVFINSGGSTAGQKQLAKILATISPATIASIAPGARIVFATNPFGVQQPLPGFADREIKQAMADELRAAEAGTGGRSQVVIGPDKVDRSVERLRRGVYGKAYVVVRRQGWDPSFVASLVVVDPNGERLVSATTMLSERGAPTFEVIGTDLSIATEGGPPIQPEPAKASDQGKPIELSQDAKNLANISPATGGGGFAEVQDVTFVAVSLEGEEGFSFGGNNNKLNAGAAAAIMRDPVAHEPLSYFVGESVRQVMPEDKPVVALLSDELFSKMRGSIGRGTTTAQVAKTLVDAGYEFIDQDGWQVAKPLDIDRCQKHRVDRKAFKSFLDSAGGMGAAPLASVAQYALTSPDTNSSLWDVTYAGALYGSAVSNEVSDTRGRQREALRIYARMPEAERRANGRTVSLNAVSSSEVSSLVFRSTDGPRPIQNGGPRNVNMSVAVTSSFPNPEIPDAMDLFGPAFERTDVFVGVPPQTGLLMDGRDDVVLRIFDPKTGQSQIMSPDQVGSYRAMGEQPWGQQMASGVGESMKVQVLSRRRVNLQLNFGGRYQMSRSLSDYAATPQSRLVAWNELPLEVQDKINASYKRSKDAYSNSQFEFGPPQGVVRPPRS